VERRGPQLHGLRDGRHTCRNIRSFAPGQLRPGHGGIDGGAGYTYFDPHTGYEFSAVAGLTYNFWNTNTNYQNGIDAHLEWGISKLWTELQVGLVGYYFQQLTADIGQPHVLGDFKSRVVAVGPQIGYFFPIGDMQGYINLKGYREFAAQNRAEGWNVWLTLSLSPKAKTASTAQNNVIGK
jgi:hypothetical protein